MTTPLLQHEGGAPPKRIGLAHTSIAPYGVFKTRDGADILISIQSDREWRVLAEKVMGDKALAADPDFATNIERVKRRAETDGRVAAAFGALDVERADGEARGGRHRLRPRQRPGRAGAASASAPHHGRLAERPGVLSGAGRAWAGEPRRYGPVPALGEHSEKIRAEFPALKRSRRHSGTRQAGLDRRSLSRLGMTVPHQAWASAARRPPGAPPHARRADQQHERHRRPA